MTTNVSHEQRLEFITRGDCPVVGELADGVQLRIFASDDFGARGLSTGVTLLRPRTILPFHNHPFSEVVTVLEGNVVVQVEGRSYRVQPYDAMHLPAGIAHRVRNESAEQPAILHWAKASAHPAREFRENDFDVQDRTETDGDCPEHLTRFEQAESYELAPRTLFRDLFAKRFGTRGICGGHGIFEPGSSLPCHIHDYDESISIVQGRAVCQVAGREYELSGNDTACIPRGRPHRFINRSDEPMAMIWVYAGDEPDRELLDQGCCDGTTQPLGWYNE
jgi:quercetin dioxygenase-like cupin family protein